jgi:hypothetical protein
MYAKIWILMLAMVSGLAMASPVVPVASSSLFVPRGFDDNDDIVVTLDGYLPSTCYEIAEPQVTMDGARRQIFVQTMAHVSPGPCAQVIVPFLTEVHLGRLPAGPYTVLTRDGTLRESLIVDPAPVSTQDNFLYAPIDSILVVKSATGYAAVLDGRYTDTCLRLREVA